MIEIWKTIEGYPNYQISNYGRVKSLKFNKEKILKQFKNSDRYCHINLCKNKKSKSKDVHRLVAIAFIPNSNNKPQINHIDGNKLNNNVINLEWLTCSENHKHAYDIGLRKICCGNRSQHHKLYENDVLTIHGLYLSGMTQYEISKIYDVSRSCIEHIVLGKRWKYLL